MATEIPFNKNLEFTYGNCDTVSPLIRRVIANNPGPFTFYGTGTYIIGKGTVAIIDAGPPIDSHINALKDALRGETVSHLLVTHTHLDHSPATQDLKEYTGAKSYGFGPHGSGQELGPLKNESVEEGADKAFVPDQTIADGDIISGPNWTLEAIHTPGHTSNHLCYALLEESTLFSGDHVMGWSTTVISPPDGNMGDYMHSLKRLSKRPERKFWPTHGPSIDEPGLFVPALIQHRYDREKQIINCVKAGITSIPEIVKHLYQDIDQNLHKAAARSVLSHLIHLI